MICAIIQSEKIMGDPGLQVAGLGFIGLEMRGYKQRQGNAIYARPNFYE